MRNFIVNNDPSIRNIIFDLGGVLLNLNPQLTIDAFKKIGMKDFENQYTQFQQDKLFDKLETGKISNQIFIDTIKTQISGKISDNDVKFAWNSMLQDFPPNRLKLLNDIKASFRTFVLSNTNKIHIEAYSKILQKTFGINDLSLLMEREYYSHIIKMRKPNVEIYEFVLKENNLMAHETLFIDDSPINIEAAKKAGLKTYLNKTNDSIVDLFKEG